MSGQREIGESKAVKVAKQISKKLDRLIKVVGGSTPTTTTTTTI